MSAQLVFTEIPKIKKTYQMDYANRIEAIKEALWDGRGRYMLGNLNCLFRHRSRS
jgi:hypothetical protein